MSGFGGRGGMGQNSLHAPRESRRPKSFGLALGVSLALHVLLALGLTVLPGTRHATADGPLAIDNLVIVPAGQLRLSLADERPVPKHLARGGTEESEDAGTFTVRVGALPPAETPAGSPAAAGPVVRGLPQNSSGGGGPAKDEGSGGGAEFFGVPVRGRAVVYVIDRSLSMGLNGGLEAAKREVLASLVRLPAPARFQVLCYNRSVASLQHESARLMPVSEDTRRQAAYWLTGLRAEGGTDHVAALRQALALQPDVIFFLTDADDLAAEQVRGLTRINRSRTVIHALQWGGRGQAVGPLLLLAQSNGGTCRRLER